MTKLVLCLLALALGTAAGCGGAPPPAPTPAPTGQPPTTAPPTTAAAPPAQKPAALPPSPAAAPSPSPSPSPSPVALTPIRIGMPPPSLGTWQVDVAERKGFFQQQRLAVERVQDEHGKATEALDARTRDIGLIAVDAVVRAERDGKDLVMVAGAVNRAVYSLIAARDFEQPADLKGKIVAVRDTEDATAAILKLMLRARGLADADYRLIGFDDPGLRGAAIANGTVGAALVDPPQAARLDASGFKSFGSAFETVEDYQAEAFVIRSDWGRQNEERLVRFLRAIVQAERWIYTPSNKQEAIEILASTFKLSAVEAGRLYEQYVEKLPAVPKAGELEEAGIRVVTELLDEVDAIDPPLPDPASLIDTSYVTKAR